MPLSPTEIARQAIRPGSVMSAAMAAVGALIRAGHLDPGKELTAGPLVWQAITRLQARADSFPAINPFAAAQAAVAVLQQHTLLTQPSTKETAA